MTIFYKACLLDMFLMLFSIVSYAQNFNDFEGFKKLENDNGYTEFRVDLNNDGISDIFASKEYSNESYIFINNDGRYILKYKVNNQTRDGLYGLDSISLERNKNIAFSITTFFYGGGSQYIKYFFHIKNNKPEVIQNVTFDKTHVGQTLYMKICINSKDSKKRDCYLDNSKKALGKDLVTDFHYLDKENISELMKSHIHVSEKDM